MKAQHVAVRIGTLALAVLTASAGADELTLEPGRTEVLVAERATSPTRFAAGELTNFLSRVFGTAVPVVKTPTAGMKQIVVGTNAWSAAEGLDPAALAKPDSFLIRATADRLYLCGCDGGCRWFEDVMAKGRSHGLLGGERASLFAVYEFLEKSCDCRFYFPGELGEIVPRASHVKVPLGTTTHVPDMLIRRYYHPENDLYHGAKGWIAGNEHTFTKGLALNWLRLRMGTFDIPCCHGINRYYYLDRFGKTHPEYFALKKDGTRFTKYEGYESSRSGMVCFSSAVTNELYEDIKAYFLGQPPESRRIHRGWGGKWEWPSNLRGKYADIMPNDSQYPCQCERCRAQYRTGDKNYMTELVWGYTRDIAQRLIDEKVPGCVAQMAYSEYSRVPDFDLPTNVMVMVAKTGPFAVRKREKTAADNAEIRKWKAKAGGVWIWTYPNKYGELNVPGVPTMTPRAWGEYYQGIAPDVFGIFAESECDRFFFNQLNYYLFSRLCWDTKTDVGAVLDEYYARMYGAAAPEAKRFCEELEDLFLDKMVGQIVNTPAGPMAKAPTLHEIWTEIYSSAKLDRWSSELARGAAKLVPGSVEARRFALFRDELWGVMHRACDAYFDQTDVTRNAARLRANPPKRNIVDWKGVWYSATRDPDERVVSDASIRVTATNGTAAALYYLDGRSGPSLKRGARYRLSFFVKGRDIVPVRKGGGAGITVCDAFNHAFPQTAGIVGTFDWMHQTFEFTSDPESNDRCLSYIYLRLSGANGTVWFDGVRMEELPDQVVKPDACAVVVDPASPKPVLCAAKQLALNLGRRFGVAKVPVRRSPEGVGFAFVVGTNRWSEAAGVRVDGLKPDEYRVKTVPGAVYVCGTGEAELYGVYGFLQREADDRFYFPGELGEIVRTGEDLPLQKLDYTAGLGDLRCFIAAKRSDDPFARHLDFCVKQTERLEEPVRPNVFRQHYLNRMFGATTVQWYMHQAFAGKDPGKSLGYALKAAAGGKDPLVLRRVELFDVQLKQKGDRK